MDGRRTGSRDRNEDARHIRRETSLEYDSMIALILLTAIASAVGSGELGACCFEEAEFRFCHDADRATCAVAFGGSWRESRACSDPGPGCGACLDDEASPDDEPCELRFCWAGSHCRDGEAEGACECANETEAE